MNRQLESFTTSVLTCPLLRGGFALLILLAWLATTANGQSQPETSTASSSIHVKHVLGFEGVKRNASGDLSIQDDELGFQQNGKPAAQVNITSIHNISLGEEDSQVGGVTMMLGKTAVPFGGGRVVSLFSHKKYDSVTIEYLDSSGGFHGSIFQLAKGKGQTVKNDLMAHGAHIPPSEDSVSTQSTPEESVKARQQWSVQVDRVDSGETTLDPCFSDAIYENLLKELAESKQFEHVFRSGDRNANDASEVLVLKTLVEKYSPGSETRRAVTTVAGATKLKVHIQLITRNGHVVLEHVVAGNVRFIGDNLRATNTVAHNAAKILKRSTLPETSSAYPQQAAGKGVDFYPMSVTSHFPLAGNVLLLFKSDLREQQRELVHAIDRPGKKYAHSLIPSPAMWWMTPLAAPPKKPYLQATAKTGQNCEKLGLLCNVFPRAILASAQSVRILSASNGCKQCHRRPTASHARNNPSKAVHTEDLQHAPR